MIRPETAAFMRIHPLLLSVLMSASGHASTADVVVYSAAPAGIAAAITASREGAKVVLVEPTRHNGGLSTSGVNTAESEHMLKWTIGGFADDFYRKLGDHYGTGKPEYYFESGVAKTIGISSHFIDCHHAQRVALSENEFVNEGRIWRMGSAYQIPYRALTPKPEQCTNRLVPGASGFSHVAFCTYRLESVWMIGGHAAGGAAAMAVKSELSVQEIDVPDLQDKLRKQKQVVDFLPCQPEKCKQLNGPPEF